MDDPDMWTIMSLMADVILPNISSPSPDAWVQRRYECDQCTKTYSRRSKLVDHQMTHTIVHRPSTFSCPICMKIYTRKDVLTRHMKTHSEERPHRCKYCHMGFKRKDHLTRHLRKHNRDKGGNVGGEN